MNYRILGRTGLRVSEISLGTVELGMAYGIAAPGGVEAPSAETAELLLNRALDAGVNLFDTARAYGASETIIGRVLAGRRSEFYLVSKVGPHPDSGASSQARRDYVFHSIDESLRELRTSTIDVVLVHSAPGREEQDTEVLECIVEARRAGKVGFSGVSVYGVESALAAIQAGLSDCLQIAYSPMDRRAEQAVIPAAAQAGVGLISRSVLLKGALTGRRQYLPPALNAIREAADRLQHAADQAGMGLPELAYRYVLSSAVPQTALVGTGSPDEFEQALHFASAGPLPGDLLDEIRSLPLPDPHLLNPGNWPAF